MREREKEAVSIIYQTEARYMKAETWVFHMGARHLTAWAVGYTSQDVPE